MSILEDIQAIYSKIGASLTIDFYMKKPSNKQNTQRGLSRVNQPRLKSAIDFRPLAVLYPSEGK